jgi:urease accessory protein
MVIESVVGRMADLTTQVKVVDALELTADQRQRPHFRLRTKSGKEVFVSLPRGTELQDGDILQLQDGVATVVQAAAEDLIEVTPRSEREWGVVAYQLGNLHREVRFLEAAMLTPYEGSTEMVLKQSGVAYTRVQRSFAGDRYGAYMGEHEHSHGHDHKHDHGHGHSHGSALHHH